MKKYKLLATSGTIEGIKKVISSFWYTTPDKISLDGEKVLQVDQEMLGYRVVQKNKRFRFECVRFGEL